MLFIASDHAGIKIKQVATKYCKEHNIAFKDLGVHVNDSVDYPDMAEAVCLCLYFQYDNLGRF